MNYDPGEYSLPEGSQILQLPEVPRYAEVSLVNGVCFVNSCVSYPKLTIGGASKPWFKAEANDLAAVGESVQKALEAFRYADLPESVNEPRDLAEAEEAKQYQRQWNKFIGFGSRKFYAEGGKIIEVEQYKNTVRCRGTTLRADGCASSEYSRHPEWGAWAPSRMGIGEAVMRAAADCLFKLPRSVRTAKEPPQCPTASPS